MLPMGRRPKLVRHLKGLLHGEGWSLFGEFVAGPTDPARVALDDSVVLSAAVMSIAQMPVCLARMLMETPLSNRSACHCRSFAVRKVAVTRQLHASLAVPAGLLLQVSKAALRAAARCAYGLGTRAKVVLAAAFRSVLFASIEIQPVACFIRPVRSGPMRPMFFFIVLGSLAFVMSGCYVIG